MSWKIVKTVAQVAAAAALAYAAHKTWLKLSNIEPVARSGVDSTHGATCHSGGGGGRCVNSENGDKDDGEGGVAGGAGTVAKMENGTALDAREYVVGGVALADVKGGEHSNNREQGGDVGANKEVERSRGMDFLRTSPTEVHGVIVRVAGAGTESLTGVYIRKMSSGATSSLRSRPPWRRVSQADRLRFRETGSLEHVNKRSSC